MKDCIIQANVALVKAQEYILPDGSKGIPFDVMGLGQFQIMVPTKLAQLELLEIVKLSNSKGFYGFVKDQSCLDCRNISARYGCYAHIVNGFVLCEYCEDFDENCNPIGDIEKEWLTLSVVRWLYTIQFTDKTQDREFVRLVEELTDPHTSTLNRLFSLSFLLRSPIKNLDTSMVDRQTESKQRRKGFVYVVCLNMEESRFKIGFSTNPDLRAKSYKTSNPQCKLIAAFPVKDSRMEKEVHFCLEKAGFNRIEKSEVFEADSAEQVIGAVKDAINRTAIPVVERIA